MICPHCGHDVLEVYWRRFDDANNAYIRSIHCTRCRARYLTRESIIRPIRDTAKIQRVELDKLAAGDRFSLKINSIKNSMKDKQK